MDAYPMIAPPQKGEMNTDGSYNSSDTPLFYAVYNDPGNASRIDYCRADVDGDGYISSKDEYSFLQAVMWHRNPVCYVLCAGAEVLGMDGASRAGGEGGADPEAMLAQLPSWDAGNPRSAYPELSDDQYQSMRYHEMADIGLISIDVANGMDSFLAWRTANPRAGYPELSAVEWCQLVAAAYQTYVASAEENGP